MTIHDIENSIYELECFKNILCSPNKGDIDLVFKSYILTENLLHTKKIIDKHGIRKEDGNKYQVNDISSLIASDREEVDSETKQLAQKILRKNRIKR